jgi:hypothetical protein
MDAGINNVIYTELHLEPKMANSKCGKRIVAGTIDRDSTAFITNLLAASVASWKPTRIILTLHGENPMPDYSTFARIKENNVQ